MVYYDKSKLAVSLIKSPPVTEFAAGDILLMDWTWGFTSDGEMTATKDLSLLILAPTSFADAMQLMMDVYASTVPETRHYFIEEVYQNRNGSYEIEFGT